ncbi:hypothetical protein B5X24_HaOG210341 [Helicoverpa armigera]|uniref:Uncharacterized protein n=1 Tax=Helicoverpa armigera TaxID=29058 RepID=A0A2W1BGX9_HELAM|nr:hypothetical protein B5X24_HaOG210341 [Helicoverpa armigera]
MLAKIINRLYRGDGHSFRSFYSGTSFRMWKDLMSHYSDLKADTKRMDHFTSLCVVLYEFLKDISLPNTMRISYIDLMKTPYDRQSELLQNYYFLCQCDRCMDENQIKYVHGATCLNKQCDEPVSIPWKEDCILVRKPEKKTEENGELATDNQTVEKIDENSALVAVNGNDSKEDALHCKECGTKYTEKHVDVFVKTMEFTHVHLQNMERASVAYVDVCQYCLDRQEGVLHPLNVMHAQTLDHAFDALIQVQLWEKACLYAEKLIPCFR